MHYRFKTDCCPTAGGREPQAGETMRTFSVTTDGGGQLHIEMGHKAWNNLLLLLGWQGEDDAKKISLLEARIRVLEAKLAKMRGSIPE